MFPDFSDLQDKFSITYNLSESKFIGTDVSDHLSQLLAKINRFDLEGKITIILGVANQQIDITVFSVLTLIVSQSPNCTINFVLDKDTSNKEGFYRIKAKILNFIYSCKLTVGKRSLYLNNNTLSDYYSSDLEKIQTWEYPSASFLPIIYFDKNIIGNEKLLFNSSSFLQFKKQFIDNRYKIFLPPVEDIKVTGASKINERLYQELRNNLLKEPNYNIYSFIWLIYAHCLSELRAFHLIYNVDLQQESDVLKNLLVKTEKQPFNRLTNPKKYYQILSELHRQIQAEEPLYILIFSFVFTNYISQTTEADKAARFNTVLQQKIYQFQHITQSVCNAIKEIVDNIYRHSSSGKGVLSLRIYKKSDLQNLKKSSTEGIGKFIPIDIESDTHYLDINIYDISSIGIVESYRKKLDEQHPFSLEDLYKHTISTPRPTLQNLENKYGLLFFNGIVKASRGFFSVSTLQDDSSISYDNYSGATQKKDKLICGTSYNAIFPISVTAEPEYKETSRERATSEIKGNGDEIFQLSEINFLEFTNNHSNDTFQKGKYLIKVNFEEKSFNDENSVENYFFRKVSKIDLFNQHLANNIFVFQLSQNIGNFFNNPGNLLRFIDKLHNQYGYRNLIFILEKIDFLQYISSIPFPDYLKDYPILFYYYEDGYYKPLLYFKTDTISSLIKYNKSILTIPRFLARIETTGETATPEDFHNSCLFYRGGNNRLLEFSSILTHKGKNLYNYFLEKCLNAEVEKPNDINQYDYLFQPYKIKDGHFRLGSKIHIKDFYYAKRMFQISPVVYNIAVQIVCYIRKQEKTFKDIQENGVTIIGYAGYSEMLVLRIKYLLDIIVNATEVENEKKIIQFNIVKDYDSEDLLYPLENGDLPYLIIIPISSTFSTSYKISNCIKKYNPHSNILDPYINIVNVVDEKSFKEITLGEKIITPKLAHHKWRIASKDNEYINIELKETGTTLNQLCLIQVYTDWHNIEDCELCFKRQPEPPLIETDKASVTPLLIFGEPIKYPSQEPNRKLRKFHKYHHYGHYKIDKRDDIYFIDPKVLLTENEDAVISWLGTLKSSINTDNKQACIISPNGKDNSQFVYYVNRILFNDNANIILFNADSDYIANFKEFYGDIIETCGYIIYADDHISTGNTFSSISQYLYSCGRKKFNLLITLISRLNTEAKERLCNSFINDGNSTTLLFERFVQKNIPTIISSHLQCPVCAQKDNYLELAKIANLDAGEYYLYKNVQRLIRKEIIPLSEKNPFRSYDIRIDELEMKPGNELREKDFKNLLENPFSFESSLKFFIEEYLHTNLIDIDFTAINTEQPVERETTLNTILQKINETIETKTGSCPYSIFTIKMGFIKIISQPPFVNYYKIRKWVFNYLESALIEKLESPTDDFSDYDLRVVKLYLKRISSLKGNFLVKANNYKLISNLYQKLHDRKNGKYSIAKLISKRTEHILNILKWLKQKGIVLNDSKDTQLFSEGLENKLSGTQKRFANAITDVVLGKYYYLFIENIDMKESAEEVNEESLIYSARAIKNIEHVIKTRSDFHYYVAILIKEITKDNEVKAIYLEKELTEWFDKLNKDKIPFRLKHLVRIVKLENTGILKKYSEMLLEKLIELNEKGDFTFKDEYEDFIAKRLAGEMETSSQKSQYYQGKYERIFKTTANLAAKYRPLFDFLNTEVESASELIEKDNNNDDKTEKEQLPKIQIAIDNNPTTVSESFFHYMMLMWFLYSDENDATGKEWQLEDKMQFIIDRVVNILRMKEDKDIQSFIFVIHKHLNKKDKLSDKNVAIYTNKEKMNSEHWDYDQSFLQKLAEGVKMRDGGGPQNIIEFVKEKTKCEDGTEKESWRSLKRFYKMDCGSEIFEDDYSDKGFAQGYLDRFIEGKDLFKEKNHLLFYRITQMEYKEMTAEDTDELKGEITTNPQAILVVASNKKRYYKAEKIRYLLLLKKHLSSFFKHHYENDSYSNSIIEKNKNLIYRDISHGINKFASFCGVYHNKTIKVYQEILNTNKLIVDENKSVKHYEPLSILKKKYSLFYNLSFNQLIVTKTISEKNGNKELILKSLDADGIELEKHKFIYINEIIYDISKTVATTEIDGIIKTENFFEPKFEPCPPDNTLEIHIEIFKIIISEIFRNIKKTNKSIEKVEIKLKFICDIYRITSIVIENPFIYTSDNAGYGTKMIEDIMNTLYNGSEHSSIDGKFLTILKF